MNNLKGFVGNLLCKNRLGGEKLLTKSGSEEKLACAVVIMCKQRSSPAESLVSVGLPGLEHALGMLIVIPKLLGGEADGDGSRGGIRATDCRDGLGDISDGGHNGTRGDLGIFASLFQSCETFHDLRLKSRQVHMWLIFGVGFKERSADRLNVGLELGINIGLKGGLGVGLNGGEVGGHWEVLEGLSLNADGLDGGGKDGDESDSHGSRSFDF